MQYGKKVHGHVDMVYRMLFKSKKTKSWSFFKGDSHHINSEIAYTGGLKSQEGMEMEMGMEKICWANFFEQILIEQHL